MIPFAQYLRGLASDGDLVTIDESADVPPDVVAAEALRASGPALRYRRADGVDLASGMFSGPDQMQRRESKSWSRLALGFGLSPDASFVAVLDTIAGLGPSGGDADPTYAGQTASRTVDSVQDLNLPQGTEDVWPSLTLGVASVSSSEGSHWAPIHGSVVSDDKLRVRTPTALSSLLDDDGTLSIALGVPPAAVATAYLLAVTGCVDVPVQACGVADDVPLVPTNGGLVPSATEIVVETTVADRHPDFQSDRREAWEHGVASTPLSLSVERVIATDDPVIPFSPVGRPLADDLQLTGLKRRRRCCTVVSTITGASHPSSGSCCRPRPNSGSASSLRISSTPASNGSSLTSSLRSRRCSIPSSSSMRASHRAISDASSAISG